MFSCVHMLKSRNYFLKNIFFKYLFSNSSIDLIYKSCNTALNQIQNRKLVPSDLILLYNFSTVVVWLWKDNHNSILLTCLARKTFHTITLSFSLLPIIIFNFWLNNVYKQSTQPKTHQSTSLKVSHFNNTHYALCDVVCFELCLNFHCIYDSFDFCSL